MTYRAKQVIEESEVIIGYDTYVSLVEDLIAGKEVYRYAMTQEVDRANQAIDFAEKGRIVSLVSSEIQAFMAWLDSSTKSWLKKVGIERTTAFMLSVFQAYLRSIHALPL